MQLQQRGQQSGELFFCPDHHISLVIDISGDLSAFFNILFKRPL